MTPITTNPPTSDEVQSALQRLLADPDFEKNRNSQNFVKYVVEETLAGRGSRLKAFSIAVSALNRNPDFDAQSNSIVRVQASRVRQLLQNYYGGPGAEDPIRICLPLGSYVPTFERVAVAQALTGPAKVAPPRIAAAGLSARTRVLSAFGGLLLLFLFGWAVRPQSLALLLESTQTDDYSSVPAVTVERVDIGPSAEISTFATRLGDQIENGLSATDDLVVRRSGKFALEGQGSSYQLLNSVTPVANGQYDFSFKLVRQVSGDIIWSRIFEKVAPDDVALLEMSRTVVQSVGDVQGAVVSDTIKRVVSWPEKPRGYLCRLTALEYLKTRSAGRGRQARNCLEAEVASNPDNARASALLAAFLTRAWLDAVPGSLGKDDLRRARELARRAHDEDPRNVRTNYMMFLTRFYSGDFDEAFDDGRLAIKADPFMAIVAAQIGAAYVSRGAYDQGSALLAPLERQDSPVPRFLFAWSWLAAYMKGEDANFIGAAARSSINPGSISLVMRIVACDRKKDADCVAEASEALRRDFPGFAANVAAAFDRYQFTGAIKSRLMADLGAAGFFGGL